MPKIPGFIYLCRLFAVFVVTCYVFSFTLGLVRNLCIDGGYDISHFSLELPNKAENATARYSGRSRPLIYIYVFSFVYN